MTKKISRRPKVVARRSRVLKRLEAQLASGLKTGKDNIGPVPLLEKDKERIKREIETIKTRL